VFGLAQGGIVPSYALLVLRRSRTAERRGEHQAATAATP